MKVVAHILLLSLFFTISGESLTRETVTFHNDAYAMEQSYYPNESLMKRTVRDMKVLSSQTKNRVYARSAGLVARLRKMYSDYFVFGRKLARYYEKKWGQRHYQTADQGWKDKTFAKHREKVKKVFLLFSTAEKAFNTWNNARNQAVKLQQKQMASKFSEANKALEKELNYLKKLQQATYKDLEDDRARFSIH